MLNALKKESDITREKDHYIYIIFDHNLSNREQ